MRNIILGTALVAASVAWAAAQDIKPSQVYGHVSQKRGWQLSLGIEKSNQLGENCKNQMGFSGAGYDPQVWLTCKNGVWTEYSVVDIKSKRVAVLVVIKDDQGHSQTISISTLDGRPQTSAFKAWCENSPLSEGQILLISPQITNDGSIEVTYSIEVTKVDHSTLQKGGEFSMELDPKYFVLSEGVIRLSSGKEKPLPVRTRLLVAGDAAPHFKNYTATIKATAQEVQQTALK